MELELRMTRPDEPGVRELYAAFIREADAPLGVALVEAEIAAGPPGDLAPPTGALFMLLVDAEPAGLGGVRHLDTEVAEVKSMYVTPQHRGKGVGRELLTRLEAVAADHGCRAIRLDSSTYLTQAVALYRSCGYGEVADYNGNPKADIWLEREL